MATTKDIARLADVSVGTVSNVLTGATPVGEKLRKRVLAAMRRMNYEPNYVARSLRQSRTNTLGLVISNITDPFFPQIVRGAEDYALPNDYLVITFNSDDQPAREEQILALMRSRRVDGILLVVAPNRGDSKHIRNTLAAGVPIVCLDRIPPKIPVDSVVVDNFSGARDCVRHLIQAGHRRIAVIGGAPTTQTARDRLKGYQAALREAGILVDAALIRKGDFRVESGYQIAKEMMAALDRPTAIFVANGMMAMGVLRAVEQARLRCPEDVAVAIVDDAAVAEVFYPHLTCVAIPAYEIGRRGAELLIQKLENKDAAEKPIAIRLDTVLRIRESSRGPVPAPCI